MTTKYELTDAEHGTYAGYQRHRRAGEQACDPCLAATAAYHAARRKVLGPEPSRRQGRIVESARRDLIAAHRAEYRALLDYHREAEYRSMVDRARAVAEGEATP